MKKAIIKLWQGGKSKKYIARTLGHDIKTVRKIISKQGRDSDTETCRNSVADAYKEQIIGLFEKGLSNIRIFENIKAQGYDGSYSSLTNYTRTLKKEDKICVRFHTDPGYEAQVDFGDVGKLLDANGKLRRAYIFNMRLSYSRLDYYEVVFDQKIETFIKCHINAFEYFKGVPKTVKIDNLKSAVINASFYEPIYQSLYETMSHHYDFEIVPCRVRKPQEKGKVESGIKYIQNNFFSGRDFASFSILTAELQLWLNDYCNNRIHGTTKEQPSVLFEQKEKALLKPLPIYRAIIGSRCCRKVHSDCHVTIDHNYYSVPYKYVNEVVEVEIGDELIKISHNNDTIGLHAKIDGKGNFATNIGHYPKYKYFTPQSEEYTSSMEGEMLQIGSACKELFALIVKEQPNAWYRTVRGILNLRKTYADSVIELSCRRALAFNITNYGKIKSICRSGCYNLELPIYEERHDCTTH